MRKIILLTDYKNKFGLKHDDVPYRSGFDKTLLASLFYDYGFETEFIHFSSVDFRSTVYDNEIILYTSSEDVDYIYKSYIEDVVYGLELAKANIIPSYIYLRANNNKVFMEILRDQFSISSVKNIQSKKYGSYEDFWIHNQDFVGKYFVIKTAKGASGSGVFLAKKLGELKQIIKKVSRSKNLFAELWEIGRGIKHNGYIKESKHRKKFIVQDFIPGLKNDWKIYVFGRRYYIFYRPVFKHREFKASGGGYDNYFYGKEANPPDGIFDFAASIFSELGVPHASLDVGFDGVNFYLLEFQCLYFGTAGILRSNEYFIKENSSWLAVPEKLTQEQVYVDAIVEFIENNKL